MPDVPSTSDYLDRLWGSAPKDVVKLDQTMRYGDESKYITVRFDTRKFPDSIELVHITDVQFGHRACNVKKFKEYISWILSVPNRFVILGGDMVDAATVLSVASPYSNTGEPSEQVYRFAELMMPMRHRIIGSVAGNHERRSEKTYGNLGSLIATLLKIPYSQGRQAIDIHYGQHKPFKVSLWHGGTGSRTKGAKAQMLARFMASGTAQLYLVGHLHDSINLWDWREIRENGTIRLEKYTGCMSSSFLTFWGTYAEVSGLAPTDTMMWRCILYPRKGQWEITAR